MLKANIDKYCLLVIMIIIINVTIVKILFCIYNNTIIWKKVETQRKYAVLKWFNTKLTRVE